MFFDYYKHEGQEFVGRSWLISPEEVKHKAETVGPTRRRRLLSLEDLAALAEARGAGDLYNALHQGLSQLADQVGTTQSNVSYRWRSSEGSRNALVSVYPKVSGLPEPGLVADIRVAELARQLGLPTDNLRGALPATRIQSYQMAGLGLYAEGYAFRSREEIDRFFAKLGSASAAASRTALRGLRVLKDRPPGASAPGCSNAAPPERHSPRAAGRVSLQDGHGPGLSAPLITPPASPATRSRTPSRSRGARSRRAGGSAGSA